MVVTGDDLRALQRRVDELPLRVLLGLDEERRRGVEHEVRATDDLVEGAVLEQVRLVQRQRPCRLRCSSQLPLETCASIVNEAWLGVQGMVPSCWDY